MLFKYFFLFPTIWYTDRSKKLVLIQFCIHLTCSNNSEMTLLRVKADIYLSLVYKPEVNTEVISRLLVSDLLHFSIAFFNLLVYCINIHECMPSSDYKQTFFVSISPTFEINQIDLSLPKRTQKVPEIISNIRMLIILFLRQYCFILVGDT